jgi:hypothetical protein
VHTQPPVTTFNIQTSQRHNTHNTINRLLCIFKCIHTIDASLASSDVVIVSLGGSGSVNVLTALLDCAPLHRNINAADDAL